MKEVIKVGSIAELLQAIEDTERAVNGNALWFRGHREAFWKLVPSAHRCHPILESQFASHFRLRAPSVYPNCPEHTDYASWLALMQHYGVPTRLLDWTESALTACYFALCTGESTDAAAIWALSPGHLNSHFGSGLIYILGSKAIETVVQDAFDTSTNRSGQHLAVTAPHRDQRMSSQLAHFTIHGSNQSLEEVHQPNDYVTKLEIPRSAHDRLRRELRVLGVRRSTVFPDLQNLALEISELIAIES